MSTRAKARKQEEFLADYLGVRTTPNSGATFHSKGDLVDELSIFEAKTSMKPKKSYTVKKSDLDKNEKEKLVGMHQFSFLMFDFGTPVEEETYVVMRLDDFRTIYNHYKEDALE